MPPSRAAIATVLALALSGCGSPEGPADNGSPAPAVPAPPVVEPTSGSDPASPAPPVDPPAAGLTLPERFVARGTEPFWAATVDGSTLVYATPDDQAGTRIKVTREASGAGATLRGTLGGRPLTLAITDGPCSDGMSDIVYPYAVLRTLGADAQRGCAALH